MLDQLILLERSFTRFNQLVGHLFGWLLVAMVIVVFSVVVMRYGFSTGNIAFQEVAVYLHGFCFMLAMGYTLADDEHVRVDIFYRVMNDEQRAVINLLGSLLLLIPFNLFIIISSWDYVSQSWALWETSSEAGGLPFVYLLKSAIPAMAILLLLQATAIGIRSLVSLLRRDSK